MSRSQVLRRDEASRPPIPMVGTRRRSLRQVAQGFRTRTSTTPGRLRLYSLLIAAGAGLLWLVGSATLIGAQTTLDGIGHQTAPAVIDAQMIHAALADADRSAANAFLAGSAGSTGPRQRYQRDMVTASQELERAAEHNSAGSRASDELQAISTMVTDYAGLVETARANDREGFPLGATYLRAASQLMHRPRDGILARVDALDQLNSQLLARQDASLWFVVAGLVAFFLTVAVLLVLVLVTQVFLRGRFRRQYNVALLAATGVLLICAGSMAIQSVVTERNLTVAGQQAFTRLHDLLQIRALVDDANGNESLSLIARGNGAAFDSAFKVETGQLVDRALDQGMVDDAARGRIRFKGLLADEIAGASFPGEREAAVAALRAYQRFLTADAAVRARAAAADQDAAVALALGSGDGQLGAAFGELDTALGRAADIDQGQFGEAIGNAGPGPVLGVGIPLGSIMVALLVLVGVQPRIAEYSA